MKDTMTPFSIERSSDDYSRRFNEITQKKIDPNQLEDYIDQALMDVIALIEAVLDADGSGSDDMSGIERERRAFTRAGIDPYLVEATLDRIAAVAKRLSGLDGLIAKKIKHIDSVLVPTNEEGVSGIERGDGGFEGPKKSLPKLKALLLVLENSFAVDIEDEEEVSITAGVVPRTMVRRSSYRLVEIPSINRAVLVCDEMENATFVADSEKCEALGYTVQDLGGMTKSALDKFASDNQGALARIVYSNQYVDRLTTTLAEPVDSTNTTTAEVSPMLVVERTVLRHISEDHMTVAEFADKIGMSKTGIYSRISRNKDEKFGEMERYQPERGGTPQYLLSKAQQEWIQDLGKSGINEGDIPFKAMAKELDIDIATLDERVRAKPSSFGPVRKARGEGKDARVERMLSPSQQADLRAEGGLKGAELHEIPAGSRTLEEMAEDFGISVTVISRHLRELKQMNPDLFEKRITLKKTGKIYYIPEQIGALRAMIVPRNIIDHVPEGFKTVLEVANELGVHYATLTKRMSTIDKSLFGKVDWFREPGAKGSGVTLLSLDQQEMLREQDRKIKLSSIGRSAVNAPDAERE